MIKCSLIQLRLLSIVGFVLIIGSACEEKINREKSSNLTPKKRRFIPDSNYVGELFLNYLPLISEGLELNTSLESLNNKGYRVVLADLNNDSLIDAIVDYSFHPNFIGNSISEIAGLIYYKNIGDTLIVKDHSQDFGGNFGSRNEIKKIDNGVIYMEVFEYAPDDGACCPTISTTTTIRIKDDKFTKAE